MKLTCILTFDADCKDGELVGPDLVELADRVSAVLNQANTKGFFCVGDQKYKLTLGNITTQHPLYVAALATQIRDVWMKWRAPIIGLPEGTAAWAELNAMLKPYRQPGEDVADTIKRLQDIGVEAVDETRPEAVDPSVPPADPTIPAIPGGDQ